MSVKRLMIIMLIGVLLLTFQGGTVQAQGSGPQFSKPQEKILSTEAVSVDALEDLPPEIRAAVAEHISQNCSLSAVRPACAEAKCCALRIAYRILRDRNGKMIAYFYQIVEHCWDNGILTTARVSIVVGSGYPAEDGPGWKYLGITASGTTGGVGTPSFTSAQTGRFGYWDGTQYTRYASLTSVLTINGDGSFSSNTGDVILP